MPRRSPPRPLRSEPQRRREPARTVDAPAPHEQKSKRQVDRASKLQAIRLEAERQFARFGFEGASLESIATSMGISRHNLLYYFPGKEPLYRAVLDDVMAHWLTGMADLSTADAPEQALRNYVRAKLVLSRDRPDGVKVYTQEVMAGAPRYARAITEHVRPLLDADVRRFEHWAEQGLIRKMDFVHLMFTIWIVTQGYADHAAQLALLLGKPALDADDFARATQVITHLLLAGLVP